MTDRMRATGIRWLKFNAVGGIGIVVQLACLAVLTTVLRVNYLVATALAVEAAVVHNFCWHERFTWDDRGHAGSIRSLQRFAKFNVTTGAFSILGNIASMWVFVSLAHLPFVAVNLASITACSLVNFLVSDRLVFRKSENPGPNSAVERIRVSSGPAVKIGL